MSPCMSDRNATDANWKVKSGLKACPDLENILNSPYKNLKKYISYPEGWENLKSNERLDY